MTREASSDPFGGLLRDVERGGPIPSTSSTEETARAVMCTLAERLTAGEAHEVLEHLPAAARPLFDRCMAHREGLPVERYDDAEFLRRVADHLGITPVHAEALSRAVFQAVHARLDAETIEHVAIQLPRGLKELWLGTRPVGSPTPPPDETRRAVLAEIEEQATLPPGVTGVGALAEVLCLLTQRLSGGEARDLVLTLPASLRALVATCMLHRDERPTVFDKETFLRRLADHFGVSSVQAEQVARVVLRALRRVLPPKEVRDAESQLPADLADLWAA
jgi:uncharacterized protein (DUF2267 family)